MATPMRWHRIGRLLRGDAEHPKGGLQSDQGRVEQRHRRHLGADLRPRSRLIGSLTLIGDLGRMAMLREEALIEIVQKTTNAIGKSLK